MDGLKEIFEAMSQRIKSPFFGYIFLAFVAINWQSVFYLLFSGKPTLMKFLFFDANTNWISIFVAPLILGGIAAIAAPWIALFGTYIAEEPTNRRRLRIVMAASKISKLRDQLREEQSKEVESLIQATKQDAEVQKIENQQLRERLEKQVADARTEILTSQPVESTISNKTKADGVQEHIKFLEQQRTNARKQNNFKRAKELENQINELTDQVNRNFLKSQNIKN